MIISFTFLGRFERRFVASAWLCAVHRSYFGIFFHFGDITGRL